MVINYTIIIGNIIEIGSIVGGGLAVFLTLKTNMATLKEDVSPCRTSSRNSASS